MITQLLVAAAPATPTSPSPAPGGGACGAQVVSGTTLNSCPVAIPGLTQVQTLIGYTMWGAVALSVIGVLILGGRMAIAHQQGQTAGGAGKVVLGLLILGVGGAFLGTLMGFSLFTTTPQAIPGLTIVQTIISYVAWGAVGACVIGVIIVGARMVIAHHEGRHGDVQKLAYVVGGALVVASASTLVGALI